MALASAVSGGLPLPDQDQDLKVAGQDVLVLNAEDHLSASIVPRLRGLEADLARIHTLRSDLEFSEPGIEALEENVERFRARLVIIDPLQSYLGAHVDLHRANETRPPLQRLAGMAARHKCAVLLVRHLGKGQKDKAIYGGLGSIDISGACRSILLAGHPSGDSPARGLVHIKSNVAQLGPAVGYSLLGGLFAWMGDCSLTADMIQRPSIGRGTKETDRAIEFLRSQLANGPQKRHTLLEEATRLKISESTLVRASMKEGITHLSGGHWALPEAVSTQVAGGDATLSEALHAYLGIEDAA
jgi:hypothetical protein